jgi:23S rRNA pseudouridine2605 synthase
VRHPPDKHRHEGAKPSDNHARKLGLARALSKLGFCSRAKAAEIISAGRVTLNNRLRHDPEAPVYLERDRIQVDGHCIEAAKKIYLMLNKPRGVVTTTSDEKGRSTVYEYVGASPWLAPVGRLDKASEGLLLLTNDSEWAARVLAPQTHLEKMYHVQIAAIPDVVLLNALAKGVQDGNDFLRVKSASILRAGHRNSWLQIILEEGKNRHIRRMLEQMLVEVLRLGRVSICPLVLGDLRKGKFRTFTPAV